MQNWHMIGSTLWMEDNWSGLKATRLPHFTRLLIVDNDTLMLDNPDFFDSSSIIFFRAPLETMLPFFAFAYSS